MERLGLLHRSGNRVAAGNGEKPMLTHWYVPKQCPDENRRYTNVALSDVIKTMDFFEDIHDIAGLKHYMKRTPHIQLGIQYELL